jgi:hypothetical protein
MGIAPRFGDSEAVDIPSEGRGGPRSAGVAEAGAIWRRLHIRPVIRFSTTQEIVPQNGTEEAGAPADFLRGAGSSARDRLEAGNLRDIF